MAKKIALTGFGEQVKLGLAPQIKDLIGKEIKTSEEWRNLMLEIGTSNYAILTLK